MAVYSETLRPISANIIRILHFLYKNRKQLR